MGKALSVFCALTVLPLIAAEGSVKKAEPSKTGGGDAAIERNISERFAKSKISANGFSVKVSGGTATIEGRTNVIQHKGVATRLAKLGGAKSVNNKIVVSEEARQKAIANLAAGRRRAQSSRSAKKATPVERSEPRNQTPRKENRLVPHSGSEGAGADDKPVIRRAVVRWVK